MKAAPWFSLIGLAFRAGKIDSGEEAVMAAVRGHKAKLVILAGDASERTKSMWENKCSFYDVPLCMVVDRHKLGAAMGKAHRVVVAVNEKGFAEKLRTLLDQ